VTSEGQSPARERDDAAARAAERPGFDTSVAHQARMYDYWLGGKDNFAADRKAAQESLAAFPGMAHLARANRAFLGRVIRYLAGEAGIRQFLDVGTGIPTASNTHQVAQEVAPECRVVYVDYDPVVLSHARALLTSTPEGATDYIDEDPYGLVAQIMAALPSGSYLAISHLPSDLEPKLAESRDRVNRLSHQQYTHRSHAEVLRFFDGLDMIEPGLVELRKWRPTIESTRMTPGWCGLGRKP